MGGSVSRTEGECEVEYSSEINLEEFKRAILPCYRGYISI